MTFAIDLASPRTPQNALPPSGLAGRLQPVPTGSISTRSVKASQVSGLSIRRTLAPSRPADAELGEARTDETEMEKRRSRARPAIEDKGHRPVRRDLSVFAT